MLRPRAARPLVALLAVAAVANAAAACTTSVPAPLKSQSQSLAGDQTLRVHLPEAPRSLDPALGLDEREQAVVSQFSEPLLKGQSGLRDVQPAAAESYSVSPDGTTWTFRIRANARWSDGQPVRAQDFVYAWKRLIDPRTAAPHADWFAGVVKGGVEAAALDAHDSARVDAALGALGLSAPDDQTFQVTAPQPVPQLKWIATLAEGGPERPDLVARPGGVGNGPFHVSDASKDHTTLVPNPSYWAGRTTLSKLVFDYSSEASALSRFRSGELEVLAGVTGTVTPSLRHDLVRLPEPTVFWLDFNVDRPPFTDPRVRQAFAEAIDRDLVTAEGFAGRAQPATTLIPNGLRGYHPDYGKPEEFNPSAAKQLLDQAQVTHEQLANIPLIVRDRAFDKQIADVVASQLQRNLGVTVTVQPLSIADYTKHLHQGDFGLAGPTGWTADYPDQQDFFDVFQATNGNNGARYRSQRYDSLVRAADIETSDDKRDQLYSQAAQLLEQDTPVTFLVQRERWGLVQPYVKGGQPVPIDNWPGQTYSASLWIAAH